MPLPGNGSLQHIGQRADESAKRRGMDFVTITDEDSIDGCLEISHLRDTFVSVKLTARFAHSRQAIQILCFGITPEHHEWLTGHRHSIEEVAAYLDDRDIAAGLHIRSGRSQHR